MFSKGSRTGLNLLDRQTDKARDGVYLGTKSLNLRFQKKGLSFDQSSTLTFRSGQIRHRMCCWKVASATTGTLMVAGNYQGHGPASPVHKIERKASKWLHVVQGGDLQKFRQHPGPITHDQKFGQICPQGPNKEKNVMALLESRSSTMFAFERNLLRRSGRRKFKGTVQNARKKWEPCNKSPPCNVATMPGESWCTQDSSRKSRYAFVVDAHESTRTRTGRLNPEITKVLLLRRVQFIGPLKKVVHKPIPKQ